MMFYCVVLDFVIQGGDLDGIGEGGFGYMVVEVPLSDFVYKKGVVVMVKTQIDPVGASGS